MLLREHVVPARHVVPPTCVNVGNVEVGVKHFVGACQSSCDEVKYSMGGVRTAVSSLLGLILHLTLI